VVSINASGHKFGFVYPGIGWVMWRSRAHLPESLVFHDAYLGKDQITITLNFSKSGSSVGFGGSGVLGRDAAATGALLVHCWPCALVVQDSCSGSCCSQTALPNQPTNTPTTPPPNTNQTKTKLHHHKAP